MHPNNLVMTLMGAGLLWVGWFGFNAGSSVNSNFETARALTVTQVAAATAALAWMIIEAIHHHKATSLGLCSGILAGLVAITPAAGVVGVEGAMALGASKWRTIATVIVPAAYRGIVTAILLALARVAGETAPLLFTAFGNRFWSNGLSQPTATLPVVIYTYAVAPYDDWHRQAWAAGLVLLGLILVINILARTILSRGIAIPRS